MINKNLLKNSGHKLYCPTMEHPYQLTVTKLRDNKSFHGHSPLMNVYELWNSWKSMQFIAHSVTYICDMSIKTQSLLFKLIPSSFLLLLFLITSLSILIGKGSSVLKMRCHLSAFTF